MIDKIYITIFVFCFIVALGLTAYALYRKFKKKKFIPAGTVMVRTKDGRVVPYAGKQNETPIGYLVSDTSPQERFASLDSKYQSIAIVDWSQVKEHKNEK